MSVTEVLRSKVDPVQLATTLLSLALGTPTRAPDLNAVTYIYDRLDGRPRQSVDVTADDSPQVQLYRQMMQALLGGVPLNGTDLPQLPPSEAEPAQTFHESQLDSP